MKASELRVGNWISVFGGTPQQVTAHYIFLMETYVPSDPNEANYEEVTEGVPLTEEWLIKFGFSLRGDDVYEYDQLKIELVIWSDADPQFLPKKINGNALPYYRSMKAIDYVHQLQNLYFALTGEELTVKETV